MKGHANTISDATENRNVPPASLLARRCFFIFRYSALARVVSDRRSLTCIAEVRFENAFMDFQGCFYFSEHRATARVRATLSQVRARVMPNVIELVKVEPLVREMKRDMEKNEIEVMKIEKTHDKRTRAFFCVFILSFLPLTSPTSPTPANAIPP